MKNKISKETKGFEILNKFTAYKKDLNVFCLYDPLIL